MDIAGSTATSLAAQGVKASLKSLWKQLSYALDYKGNLEDLNSEIVGLTNASARLQTQVKASQNRLEEIYEDVEIWLKHAEEEVAKAKEILEEDKKAKKSCCMGLVPNIKVRHKFGRIAKKEASIVEALKGKGIFVEVGYPVPPAGIVAPRGYEAFESRAGVFGAIVQALEEADVVGVWGLGGVGKTTLVRKVAGWMNTKRMYTAIAMTTLGQKPHINTIQREIAEWLGFEMKEESTAVRASLLLKRLKQEKSVLILLDDVWDMVDLDAVGIPCGGDKNFCKILLTSRSRQALADMDVAPEHSFPLNTLTKEEGWDFFQKSVGDMQDSAMQLVATEIVARCGGLPVLILPVAKALKKKGLSEWNDTLEELKKGDFEENAFPVLELSYKFLKEDEKALFLLCGQVGPRRIFFSDLFIYSIGLGLLRNYDTLEKAKNRLRKLVNHLKRSSLLEDNNNNIDAADMHDVVYSFSISLASKEHFVLVVAEDDKLTEWPRTDVLENCTSIYLPHRVIPKLPQILNCPRLKLFILFDRSRHSLQIHQSFFSKTKELRVLDLRDMQLSPMPSSIGFLLNLETLYLYRCKVKDISLIGDLEKLQVLCLVGSDIVYLPTAIGRLTCLRLLYLSDCYKLEMIAPNVLSCLTQLEELLMGGCPVRWEFQDENSGSNTAKLDELKSLRKLTRLEIQINNAKIIPNNLFSAKWEMFKIFLGDVGWEHWSRDRDHGTSRTLKLIRLQTNDWPMEEVSAAVKRTEDLYMDMLSGFGDDICKLDTEGFPQLKHLSISNNHDIRYVINTTQRGYPARTIFPMLESLFIDRLGHLEWICHGLTTEGCLSKLRKLRLHKCDALYHLFSLSVHRALARLQEIEIVSCKELTEILVEDRKYDSPSGEEEIIEFPQLHSVFLQELPQLTSICSTEVYPSQPSSQETRNLASTSRSEDSASENNVAFPNLEDLTLDLIGSKKIWDHQFFKSFARVRKLTRLVVNRCNNLKYLFTSSMIKSLVGLREVEINNCKSMEDIIISEAPRDNMEKVTMVFPKLELFKMESLPRLVTACTNCGILEFPNLKSLRISRCPEMKSFVKGKPSTTKSSLFDNKVLFPKLEDLSIWDMKKVETIWHDQLHVDSFCKLKSLWISSAPILCRIFSSSMLSKIQSLETLRIRSCDSLEEIFDPQILLNEDLPKVVTNLITIELKYLPELKHIWCVGLQGILSFQNLVSVEVKRCTNLKSLFPAFMCIELSKLKEVRIKSCGLEYIIAVEQGFQVQGSTSIATFEFPCLESLVLRYIPSLCGFYAGKHLVYLPALEKARVLGCPSLEIASRPEIHILFY